MKVIATRTGQYGGRVYEPGEIFIIEDEFFADPENSPFGWMEKINAPTVEQPVEQKPASQPEPEAKVEENSGTESKEEKS